MRKLFATVALLGLCAGLVRASADDEKTVKGEGQCAKCSLSETESCQNAIIVDEGGKKVTYYLTGDVSKKFHGNICKVKKSVKATGTVKEVDGKMEMAVKEIELVK